MKKDATLRTIWGLAKSPGLSLSDEELHMFVEARTGKESLKELSQRERNAVAQALAELKPKRKDRGNTQTERQRRMLWVLAKEAGWDGQDRLNGLAKKMFGVDRVEWLDMEQCSGLIEALKAIAKRKGESNGEEADSPGKEAAGTIKEKVAGGGGPAPGQAPPQQEKVH